MLSMSVYAVHINVYDRITPTRRTRACGIDVPRRSECYITIVRAHVPPSFGLHMIRPVHCPAHGIRAGIGEQETSNAYNARTAQPDRRRTTFTCVSCTGVGV